MSAETITRIADIITDAWKAGRQLEGCPKGCCPRTGRNRTRSRTNWRAVSGLPVAGWKFGATAPASMRSMKVDEPVPGRIFGTRLVEAPAVLKASEFRTPIMEAEFAVRLEAAFPARAEPYTRADVEPEASIFLAIEVADYRIAPTSPPTELIMIADNGGGAGWVLGAPVANWKDVDFTTVPVEVLIDGKVVAEGLTGDGRIDPIDVSVWAVNHLSQRGLGLAAGSYLSTGSANAPVPMGGGTECVCRFGPLGEARVTFER